MTNGLPLSTEIADVTATTLTIRGNPIEKIVREMSFERVIEDLFDLSLDDGQRDVLRACLVVNADHGRANNGVTAAQAVVSVNRAGIAGAVASGLLVIGESTVSPRSAMQFLAECVSEWRRTGRDLDDMADAWIRRAKEQKARIPGYGSPFHPDGDPRVPPLEAVARRAQAWGDHAEVFVALGAALERNGRFIPANEVGMAAACLADIGLSSEQGEALAVVATVPSLAANALLAWHSPPRFLVAEAWTGYPEDE